LLTLASRRGHDLCHHEPEAISELLRLYDIESPADLLLPSREDFRRGCHDYECYLYAPKPAPSPRRNPLLTADDPPQLSALGAYLYPVLRREQDVGPEQATTPGLGQ
jgi:hypothetical protein